MDCAVNTEKALEVFRPAGQDGLFVRQQILSVCTAERAEGLVRGAVDGSEGLVEVCVVALICVHLCFLRQV